MLFKTHDINHQLLLHIWILGLPRKRYSTKRPGTYQ